MSVDESAESAANPLDSKYLGGLLGNISAAQDHLNGNDGVPLSLSFLSANTAWTAREKDTFFHALSVHSRLRPDLISHEIKTKSVQDVCNYLAILHAAASRQKNTIPYLQRRQDLPIAVEVSPEWVAMEEEKAADLASREQDWQRELTAEHRRAGIKLLKKDTRAKLHDTGRSQREAAIKHQVADADLCARREDVCGSLGFLELTAIETILRGAPDFSDPSQIKQPSVLHDPTLQRSTHVRRLEATRTLPISPTNAADMQSEGPSPLGGSGPPPTSPPKQEESLSPAARRRYQKRLYMRRKRASASGTAAIDDSLERLKPGRKKVKRSPSPEDEPEYDLESVEDEGDTRLDCGDDGPSMNPKRYPRAKKMALNEFRDLGVAAEDLERMGFDVLNPEGVAKMLKLSGDTAGHGSRISTETIQLLSLHVVFFVTSLVYRAITLREQERILKSETKVWKLSEKSVLAREHIEKALSITCSNDLNKARFFDRVIIEMNGNTEEVVREFAGSNSETRVSPLHRDIYTPLVWLPEPGDDQEVAEHMNDGETDSELLEEEGLDKLDMDVEMAHESGLWEKAQRFQASGPSVGVRTVYRSAEFIDDSD